MTPQQLDYNLDPQAQPPDESQDKPNSLEPIPLATYPDAHHVRQLANRLIRMLPSVQEVGQAGALALAHVALRLGLNPFLGEVWAIPKKGGTFSLMCGIKGLRRAARNQAAADGGHYTPYHRLPNDDEMQGVTLQDRDVARACDIHLWTDKARAYYNETGTLTKVTGIGIYRHGEKTKMEPLLVARKRAEADALKQAFDLPLPLAPNDQMRTARQIADPLPERPPGEVITFAHWLDDEPVRNYFWDTARHAIGLTDPQIHDGLRVDSVRNYQGTSDQALDALRKHKNYLDSNTDRLAADKLPLQQPPKPDNPMFK